MRCAQAAIGMSEQQQQRCFESRRVFLTQLGEILRQRGELHALSTKTCQAVALDRIQAAAIAEESKGLLEVNPTRPSSWHWLCILVSSLRPRSHRSVPSCRFDTCVRAECVVIHATIIDRCPSVDVPVALLATQKVGLSLGLHSVLDRVHLGFFKNGQKSVWICVCANIRHFMLYRLLAVCTAPAFTVCCGEGTRFLARLV